MTFGKNPDGTDKKPKIIPQKATKPCPPKLVIPEKGAPCIKSSRAVGEIRRIKSPPVGPLQNEVRRAQFLKVFSKSSHIQDISSIQKYMNSSWILERIRIFDPQRDCHVYTSFSSPIFLPLVSLFQHYTFPFHPFCAFLLFSFLFGVPV